MSVIPVNQRGYANPQYLAETDWLVGQLNNPKVRIIDARPPDQYTAGHIPGAVNLSGFGGIPRAADGDMASAEDFARVAGSLGIGNDVTLVVYGCAKPNDGNGCVGVSLLRATRCASSGRWLSQVDTGGATGLY